MNPYEPILKEIADGMLETAEIKPNFSNNALLDAALIFQTVWMDKIHDNMQEPCFTQHDQLKMVESAGNELRKLIHTYTGLDTHELVKNYE
jgi:hypothetical protein